MARITSPGGETEFFQVTELQQAFEKELKTGEKAMVAPGVREASFLREAPIRAEFFYQWADFKNRLLNPPVEPQPEVPIPICPAVIATSNFNVDLSASLGTGFKPTANPILTAEWVQTNNNPNPPPFGTVGGLPYYSGVQTSAGVLSGANFVFANMVNFDPFIFPSAQYQTIVYPNALTFTLKIQNVDSVSGTAGLSTIRIEQMWNTYYNNIFSCNNIPDTMGSQMLTLAELVCDAKCWYYSINPTPCFAQFLNYSFTNFYP